MYALEHLVVACASAGFYDYNILMQEDILFHEIFRCMPVKKTNLQTLFKTHILNQVATRNSKASNANHFDSERY